MQPRKRIWVAYLAIQICFVSPRICFSFWHAMPPFTLWKRGALWSHVRSKGTGLGFTRMASTHACTTVQDQMPPSRTSGGRSKSLLQFAASCQMPWWLLQDKHKDSKFTRLLFFWGLPYLLIQSRCPSSFGTAEAFTSSNQCHKVNLWKFYKVPTRNFYI